MTNCPKCGAELQENCTKCPQCGQDITLETSETTEVNSMRPTTFGAITVGALIGGVVLCALIGALIGGHLFNSHDGYNLEGDTIDSVCVDTVAGCTYEEPASKPSIYGSHTLTGSIGGADMVLEIEVNTDDNISGSAYYTKYGPSNRLTCNGNIDSDGNINLSEYDEFGNWAGDYNGTFDGETFNGTYSKEGHSYDFTLTAE